MYPRTINNTRRSSLLPLIVGVLDIVQQSDNLYTVQEPTLVGILYTVQKPIPVGRSTVHFTEIYTSISGSASFRRKTIHRQFILSTLHFTDLQIVDNSFHRHHLISSTLHFVDTSFRLLYIYSLNSSTNIYIFFSSFLYPNKRKT